MSDNIVTVIKVLMNCILVHLVNEASLIFPPKI